MSTQASDLHENQVKGIKATKQQDFPLLYNNIADTTQENISLTSKLYKSVSDWKFFIFIVERLTICFAFCPILNFVFGNAVLVDCLVRIVDRVVYLAISCTILEFVRCFFMWSKLIEKELKRFCDIIGLGVVICGFVMASNDYSLTSRYVRLIK